MVNATLEAEARIQMANKGMSFAPYILGLFVDAYLFGLMWMMFSQWCRYSFASDRWPTRTLIVYLVTMSSITTVFIVCMNMSTFAYDFGVYANFLLMNWMAWCYIFLGLTLIPTSGFYALRAYHLLGRSKLFGALSASLLFACSVGSIGAKVCAPSDIVGSSITTQPLYFGFIFVWLLAGMGSDLLNTIVIMWCLLRSKTGWSQTDAIITKLVILAAESQLGPTIIMIAFLVTDITPNTSFFAGFFVCTLKVYVVGILHVLNQRHVLRVDMSNIKNDDNTFKLGTAFNQATVHVEVETFVESHRIQLPKAHRSVNRDNLDVVDEEDGKTEDGEVFELDDTSRTDLNSARERLYDLKDMV